jgi:hypothetical protein
MPGGVVAAGPLVGRPRALTTLAAKFYECSNVLPLLGYPFTEVMYACTTSRSRPCKYRNSNENSLNNLRGFAWSPRAAEIDGGGLPNSKFGEVPRW